MKSLLMAAAALGLCVAVGCAPAGSSRSAPPAGTALPPPESAAPESAAPTSPEPAGAAPESGGVVVETIEPDPSASAGPSAITIPEQTGWTHPEVPLTRQQADIETCFNFASAQIERENQIDDDRYELSNERDFSDFHSEAVLARRVDYYSERRRRGSLFDSCMRSKGYLRN